MHDEDSTGFHKEPILYFANTEHATDKNKKTLKYEETYSTTRKVKQGSYFNSSRILKEAVTVITCCQRSRLCQTVLKMISTTTVDVDINLHQIEVHAINLIKTSQNLTIKQQFNLSLKFLKLYVIVKDRCGMHYHFEITECEARGILSN